MASRTMKRATVIAARVLLTLYLAALAWVTLTPSEDHAAGNLVSLIARVVSSWGLPYHPTFDVLEFMANVALFAPLGVLLPLALNSLRPRTLIITVAVGLATSAAIEFAQRFIEGRVSDPRDLLSNTLGAALGVLLLLAWMKVAARARLAVEVVGD